MEALRVRNNSNAHIKLEARWANDIGQHKAVQHFSKFSVSRDTDHMPDPIMEDIIDQPVGEGGLHNFKEGELVPAWQDSQLISVPAKNFDGRLRSGQTIQPHTGRYYPQGMITGVDGLFRSNMFPTRLVEKKDEQMTFDFNHPLCKDKFQLGVEVVEILPPHDENDGRCTEVISELFNGPGMQMPLKNQATDFFVEGAFDRADENADNIFYGQERMVHHLDANARNIISRLYVEMILPGARVLDLMSSWESHLPVSLKGIYLSGLGMNASELQANPLLADYIVHDLNIDPAVPFQDETFDTVICTASVEYLINPVAVFGEIKRVLKPGGHLIVSFSNRWFPTKAIMLWSELHEFERLGLVIEYFRKSGWSGSINSFSYRGLKRPEDDPYYAKIDLSDPVYAVWSQK
jgi:hypothetical protein